MLADPMRRALTPATLGAIRFAGVQSVTRDGGEHDDGWWLGHLPLLLPEHVDATDSIDGPVRAVVATMLALLTHFAIAVQRPETANEFIGCALTTPPVDMDAFFLCHTDHGIDSDRARTLFSPGPPWRMGPRLRSRRSRYRSVRLPESPSKVERREPRG